MAMSWNLVSLSAIMYTVYQMTTLMTKGGEKHKLFPFNHTNSIKGYQISNNSLA